MEPKKQSITSGLAVKIIFIITSALLLLIPLGMVKSLIREREFTKSQVETEVAKSYGGSQTVGAPTVVSTRILEQATDKEPMETEKVTIYPAELDYNASVTTEMLHRSIYDIVVYNSEIRITGKMPVKEDVLNALSNNIVFRISDFKGLPAMPLMTFGDKQIDFERVDNKLSAQLELPEGVKAGDEIPFEMSLKLKGTESLSFRPMGDETSLSVESPYPHPSFQGEFLPDTRDVQDTGFKATWNVLKINTNSTDDVMGVEFIDPANPYQQAERSAKYGILIIVLVFAAGLLVQFLTGKEIHGVQYLIIGLSLVLFYALLLSFSEYMAFGLAYSLAAAMTTAALTLYFRGILKSGIGFWLGLLIAVMYAANFILLQMEKGSLLAGSLLLFVVLAVVMYYTADINGGKPSEGESAY